VVRPPVWIDFETFSAVDIKKCGADVYSRDATTRALMLGWAIGDGPSYLWDIDAGEPMPVQLHPYLLHADGEIRAFNAPFEIKILRNVLSRRFPILVAQRQFRCAQVMAYGLSFNGGLGSILSQIDIHPDAAKDPLGKQLINRFSKPQSTARNVARWNRRNDAWSWLLFKEYCKQDVTILRDLWNWCQVFEPMSESEWELWFLDQKINDRGIPVDLELVSHALTAMDKEKEYLKRELHTLTGLPKITPIPLMAWLNQHGAQMDNMQKVTKNEAIKRTSGGVKLALEMAVQIGQLSSSSKWAAYDRRTDKTTQVIRDTLQFGGASRTRRWAGRGLQTHNMKRSVKDSDDHIALIKSGGQVSMNEISTSVRGAICAPPGKLLSVSDLSSIESRLAGWLTGCKLINTTFSQGLDTYKVLAAALYGVEYDQVTKEQRTFAKPAALGGQYMLGGKGLQNYAADFGVELTLEEAKQHIVAYRLMYPEIVAIWAWLKESIFGVIEHGTVAQGYYLRIFRTKEFLFIELPSGRRLSYFNPRVDWIPAPWDKSQSIPAFQYDGVEQGSFVWGAVNAHGGKVFENIIQAVARDLLAVWLQRIDQAGIDICMHVHDEVVGVSDAEKAEGDLQLMNHLASAPIDWAPGLVLTADGYTAARYRKG